MGVWAASTSFRDSDVDRIVARIIPAVQAGQLQLAALTDAYIGRVARDAGMAWSAGVDRAVVGYRGVDAGTVYRRPAVTLYTALKAGTGFDQAVVEGRSRLQSIVATDLQQARNRQASASVGRSAFTHYRRVLTGKEDCALCAIASTQLYTRGDLMPIHPGCDCGVEPVSDRAAFAAQAETFLVDTQSAVATQLDHVTVGADGRDLGLGKTSAGGRRLSDYTDLIVSRDHGEYGPTLTWRSQQFTSEADIAALA